MRLFVVEVPGTDVRDGGGDDERESDIRHCQEYRFEIHRGRSEKPLKAGVWQCF